MIENIEYLKWNLFNFDMLITFCFGVSSNLSQEKSPTAEILGKYFLRTIVPRKYMRKISAVGLFCCDKFEETPKQKVIDLSKLNKFYFKTEFMCFILFANRFLNKVLNGIKTFYPVREQVSQHCYCFLFCWKTFLFRWEPCWETCWRTG